MEIFLYPHPLRPKTIVLEGIKNGVTEMIHLLTFQSIKQCIVFFQILGGIEIFFIPHPPLKKFTNQT